MNGTARVLLPWCLERIRARSSVGARRAWVLGLQGPQGAGKSTAAAALVDAFETNGIRAVCVSIDDFYLTHAEQQAVSRRHPGNPYLAYRGYPGTHDVALGARVLDALVASDGSAPVIVPVYDKSAQRGRGDRAPRERWRSVTGPLDAVVVEGWMLGFAPVESEALDPDLAVVEGYLAAYATWNARLDALVHLDADSPETIVAWRVDAERARRDRGEDALSDDEAADYIRRFLPAYRRYVPAMRARPPCAEFARVRLDPHRAPLGGIESGSAER